MKTDLSLYQNKWYRPGHPVKKVLWLITSLVFFQNSAFPFYSLKRFLLRLFNAKVGKGVVIKPSVLIKYPWLLEIGDYAWIGEKVWIDNLALVVIGNNACLSQGAFLLTGNHNYKLPTFDLIVSGITLKEGVWIGAKAVVCPGVTCESHSILAVGSIATRTLSEYCIYQGNPAVKVKDRSMENNASLGASRSKS
jgi:putative colanic acid biosynthesis acetyltransferase WcaF